MSITKVQGLVLNHINVSEADKILTLLTKESGKIKVYARGCRRPKSRLVSSCEVFSVSDFVLYMGTNLYYINSCDLRESFYELRKDLLRLSYAAYFTEIADTVTYENMDCKSIFLLLAKTLFYLSKQKVPMGILSCAYQIKLMSLSGYRPLLKRCAVCGKEGKFTKFNIRLGGAICDNCAANADAVKINPSTLEFYTNLLFLPLSRLNTIKIDNNIYMEADRILSEFVQMHIGKQFKSMVFINTVKDLGIVK